AAPPARHPPSRAGPAPGQIRARPHCNSGIAAPIARRYAEFMVQLPKGREAIAPETFRPWMALRTVVMAADTLWICVFVAMGVMQGATRSAFFSSAFFVALFTACSIFYNRLAYVVSDAGL